MAARVLIVDDNRSIRQLLKAVLRKEPDFELVGEAVDGEEAVRLVEELKPDVIVMDHVMPKMSGAEATGAIKERFPGVEIVGYTAEDGEAVLDLQEAGVSIHLDKKEIKLVVPSLRKALLREPMNPFRPEDAFDDS